MKLNKSEKILMGIFFILSSTVILYNLFYIPLPKNDIKKEIVFQEDNEDNKKFSGTININSAKLDELKKIPGVGDSIAQRIINYREENGGFSSKSEIMNVNGIGQKKFESMKNYICI